MCGELLNAKRSDGTVAADSQDEFMRKCMLTCNTKSNPLNEAAYTNGFPPYCRTNDAGIRNLSTYAGCRSMSDPGIYGCIKDGTCR